MQPREVSDHLITQVGERGELSSWTYAALDDAIEAAIEAWGAETTAALVRMILDEKSA